MTHTDTHHTPNPLADVKRGEYIRLKASPTAPVWVRGTMTGHQNATGSPKQTT
jgi:hypothetical protein